MSAIEKHGGCMNRAQRVIKSFKDKLKEKDTEIARLNEENERLKLCIESDKRTLDDDYVFLYREGKRNY